MSNTLFTDTDLAAIRNQGVTEEDALRQIDRLKRGARPLSLNRPCSLGDGILAIEDTSFKHLAEEYDAACSQGRVMKFVPASGAASRMFENWFRLRSGNDETEKRRFMEELPRYPFYTTLKAIMKERTGAGPADIDECYRTIDFILTAGGLSYGALPKALIIFHDYGGEPRTALEEQLVEATLHTADERGVCRVHLTLSPEHHQGVREHLDHILTRLEKRLELTFRVDLSIQHPSTDTIAVTLNNEPFRDDSGSLLFRPGGHGALLKNLNELEGDVVCIKNIDNITPDRVKTETVIWKKILGGHLLTLQKQAAAYLDMFEGGRWSPSELADLENFCRRKLFLKPPPAFDGYSARDKAFYLFEKLNRPFRVCGMVKNEGEPGGGPFWVNEDDGSQSLQVVEKNQFDAGSEEQLSIWNTATHFNPVDLACGLKDYRGRPFDLYRFSDTESFIVAEKSYQGRRLKALEHPGLWNGSMAHWNTIFVEIPLSTFAPVKTVEDLLRPEHRP